MRPFTACRVPDEAAETGADLGGTGGFSWHDETPADLVASFERAQSEGMYDDDGSYGYWDREGLLWWSFDTPRVIQTKTEELVGGLGLGGVFAWGLGEDAPEFAHLEAATEGLARLNRDAKDEL
jgi:GH18 family chitinase